MATLNRYQLAYLDGLAAQMRGDSQQGGNTTGSGSGATGTAGSGGSSQGNTVGQFTISGGQAVGGRFMDNPFRPRGSTMV